MAMTVRAMAAVARAGSFQEKRLPCQDGGGAGRVSSGALSNPGYSEIGPGGVASLRWRWAERLRCERLLRGEVVGEIVFCLAEEGSALIAFGGVVEVLLRILVGEAGCDV